MRCAQSVKRNLVAGLFLALATQPAAPESIQLVPSHGIFMVPVRINEAVTIPFVLDSGAAEVSIPADVFLVLRRTGTIGQSDFIGTGRYVLADGSTTSNDRYMLHKMAVGNNVISNVVASVAPARGDPLLGQSFLLKLPGWAIDNARHALVLNDGAATTPPPPPASLTATPRYDPSVVDPLEKVKEAIGQKQYKDAFAWYRVYGTRAIELNNAHTGEYLREIYWINGTYQKEVVRDINWLTHDHDSDTVRKFLAEYVEIFSLLQSTVTTRSSHTLNIWGGKGSWSCQLDCNAWQLSNSQCGEMAANLSGLVNVANSLYTNAYAATLTLYGSSINLEIPYPHQPDAP